MIDHDVTDDFLTSPQVLAQYNLLHNIGIFKYIDILKKENKSLKDLLGSAAYIFERITIDDIMDATVWQISDRFLPNSIVFLLRPLQNKETVTVKGYQNYKMVNVSVNIESITPFEAFFNSYRRPISYASLKEEIPEDTIMALEELNPEIVVPILGPSGLYSLILIGQKMLGEKYNSTELFYMDQLMGFVSQAIQNHLHYEYSVRDAKTGLFNHGFFKSRLAEELARVNRTKSVSSLLVLDVDKFKNFNDVYGHMAGDRVLEHIAVTIKKSVRAEDIPSRFGGEEFTVLLPNTDRNVCWAVAERIRVNVSKMEVPWAAQLPRVTVSIGIVSFNGDDVANEEEILKRADAALYLSKERGRNCTTHWGSGLLSKIENN